VRTQDGEDFVYFPASSLKMAALRTKPTTSDILKVIDPKLADPELNITEVSDREG